MPSFHATRLASVRSSIVQHPPYVESALLRLSYICIDRPTTSCPADLRMYAAVDESTPPDIATATFTALREAPSAEAKFRKGTCCACHKHAWSRPAKSFPTNVPIVCWSSTTIRASVG